MIEEILSAYGLSGLRAQRLRSNENETFALYEAGEPKYVLRVRRQAAGFSLAPLNCKFSDAELIESELALLRAMSAAGLSCQRPLSTLEGKYTCDIGGARASIVAYIPGETASEGASREEFIAIGRMTREMHEFFAGERFPGGLRRYSYDACMADSLAREIDSAGLYRAGDMLPALTEIARRAKCAEFKYAHADLGLSNIILSPSGAAPIDFSLSGFAPLEMDIAGLFAAVSDAGAREAILLGYGGKTDARLIDAYFAMSILLFIACQHSRFEGEDWFREALEGWSDNYFIPLANGARLL